MWLKDLKRTAFDFDVCRGGLRVFGPTDPVIWSTSVKSHVARP